MDTTTPSAPGAGYPRNAVALISLLGYLISLIIGAAGSLYPPLRDQSAAIPAVSLLVAGLIVMAVTFAAAVHSLGWRKIEANLLAQVEANPKGAFEAVSATISPVVHDIHIHTSQSALPAVLSAAVDAAGSVINPGSASSVATSATSAGNAAGTPPASAPPAAADPGTATAQPAPTPAPGTAAAAGAAEIPAPTGA